MKAKLLLILASLTLIGFVFVIAEQVPVNGTSLQTHSPIVIRGNSSFTPENGVTGGIGTLVHPYVIRNWSISATNGIGIEISNTTAHFLIQNVIITSSRFGIVLNNTKNGVLSNSTLYQNNVGVLLKFANFTGVFNNNFVNNVKQANDTGGFDTYWQNGYRGGGNYWSDYKAVDNCSGFNQENCPAPDGIADKPYHVLGNADSWDTYPLMKPYYPDTTPPYWPLGQKLSGDHLTSTSLTLNWTRAMDDTGVVDYEILEGGRPIANVTATKTTYNVVDLKPGTSYTFKVEAGDRADNWSVDGPSLTVTTLSLPFWFLTGDFWMRNWYIPVILIGALVAVVATYNNRRTTKPKKPEFSGLTKSHRSTSRHPASSPVATQALNYRNAPFT